MQIKAEPTKREQFKIAYETVLLPLIPVAIGVISGAAVPTAIAAVGSAFLATDHVKSKLFSKTIDDERTQTIKLWQSSLLELLESEDYSHLLEFFINYPLDYSGFTIQTTGGELIECFWEHYQKSKKDAVSLVSIHKNDFKCFVNDLMAKFQKAIQEDTKLDQYWQNFFHRLEQHDMHEKISDLHQKSINRCNHNADYRKKWNERCCLHKNESQPLVTLEKIFVMPEVQVGKERLKVGDCVKDFLENDTQHILLLLGHGGYGKTSFVARMAARTNEYTDRPLHIFRLREFADTDANELYKRIAEMAKLENNAVLVFDGLDELCMVGGGDEEKKSLDLIYHLTKFWRDCTSRKIIVTSRPQYVNARLVRMDLEGNTSPGLDKPVLLSYEYAVFADHQRTELADKLERADSSLKNSVGCQHVRAYSGEKDDPIYGSPFLLYLICAGRGITEECFSNRWLLFRTVFHDINIKPAYRGTTPTQQEEFAGNAENAEKLYRITSRLAYEIYKSRYKKPYFQKEEVLNIIRALYQDETPKLISALGDCYALCAYFKQTENGAVEFAHNHVRDFFLCEYILQGLDDCYSEYPKPEMTPEKCGKLVADWLSDNFKYADVEEETGNFLQLAAKQKKTACPNVELYFKPDELEHVFNVFCKNGGLREYRAEEMPIGVQTAAENVIQCSARFLKTLLPETNGLIRWFDVKQLNDGERVIIEQMGFCLNKADLGCANLSGANLRHASLSSANLRNADLSYADLSYADLRGADLSGADLFGVNLSGANLDDAKLSGAELCGADLFGANLRGAYLSGAILRDANLIGADLRGADLRGADLRGANLIAANLIDANLSLAKLSNAYYDKDTVLPQLTFSQKISMKKC